MKKRIQLQWPTDYNVITQHFGANRDNYMKYGLPGHDGLDIRAPYNSRIYACATGMVFRTERNAGSGAYGRHIRIQHKNGFLTIYAHLNQIVVEEGDIVAPGQLIGYADNTGNSRGHHLHLGLKHEGASLRGETAYPSDIIDPTPYLLAFGKKIKKYVFLNYKISEWELRRWKNHARAWKNYRVRR